jgi:hypothetical protein
MRVICAKEKLYRIGTRLETSMKIVGSSCTERGHIFIICMYCNEIAAFASV